MSNRTNVVKPIVITMCVIGVIALGVLGYSIYGRFLDANALIGSTPTAVVSTPATTITASGFSAYVQKNDTVDYEYLEPVVLDRMDAAKLANWSIQHFYTPSNYYNQTVFNEFQKYLAERQANDDYFGTEYYNAMVNAGVVTGNPVPVPEKEFKLILSDFEELDLDGLANWYIENIDGHEDREMLFTHWLSETNKDVDFVAGLSAKVNEIKQLIAEEEAAEVAALEGEDSTNEETEIEVSELLPDEVDDTESINISLAEDYEDNISDGDLEVYG